MDHHSRGRKEENKCFSSLKEFDIWNFKKSTEVISLVIIRTLVDFLLSFSGTKWFSCQIIRREDYLLRAWASKALNWMCLGHPVLLFSDLVLCAVMACSLLTTHWDELIFRSEIVFCIHCYIYQGWYIVGAW